MSVPGFADYRHAVAINFNIIIYVVLLLLLLYKKKTIITNKKNKFEFNIAYLCT